ncbi:MAG: NAD(P)-dependent oxidoreductase [Verrucomicrobiales bacterium]
MPRTAKSENREAEPTVVTGARGMLGEAICRHLHREGIPVIGIDRRSGESEKPFRYVEADLTAKDLDELVGIDGKYQIVHCAAVLPVGGRSAEDCRVMNREIDRAIISSLKQRRGVRLIYMSGTSVYGMDEEWKTEDSPVRPPDAYVRGKLESERSLLARDVREVCLRVTAPYAPGQSASTVLKVFIERATKGAELIYHGSGTRCQDFTHVDDVAAAVLACIRRRNVGGIFNISGGKPRSMIDLAHLVKNLVPGCESPIRPSGKPDPQEHYRARFRIGKARKELGWSPRIPLEDGISEWVEEVRRMSADFR